ncbi:MAG: hypothetical protein IPN84_09525 [Sphingomonadales bacterium]|nr:hypothetical protein [Sphingomonadales bacterium]
MYLPRLCEHCLNPTCVAACPSVAIYKREDDGIVLIDQENAAAGGCVYPAARTRRSTTTGHREAEKCIFCYPRIEGGQPTVCSETCVGRIRYLGVLLYDADRQKRPLPSKTSRTLSKSNWPSFSIPMTRKSTRSPPYGVPEALLARRRAPFAGVEDGDGMEGRASTAPNTVRCRWCGMSHRFHRSSKAAKQSGQIRQ